MSKKLSTLEERLGTLGLLVREADLKGAMAHHRQEAGAGAQWPLPIRSMRLMERNGIVMGSEHLVALAQQLENRLAWRVDADDLPLLSSSEAHFQPSDDDESPQATHAKAQANSSPSDASLAMETFLHGGSFVLAEILLGQMAPLSDFWKATKEAFHLHLVQHIEIFLRFGARPPMPKVMAGKATVRGEILPAGKVMMSSGASGCSPEVQVMEICKALCFRWASPCYTKIPPATLSIEDEIFFFVHAPVRVREAWQSLVSLLAHGVPLSDNSIADEQSFLSAFGAEARHNEESIQHYVVTSNRHFVDKKQLPTEPESLREALHKLLQVID